VQYQYYSYQRYYVVAADPTTRKADWLFHCFLVYLAVSVIGKEVCCYSAIAGSVALRGVGSVFCYGQLVRVLLLVYRTCTLQHRGGDATLSAIPSEGGGAEIQQSDHAPSSGPEIKDGRIRVSSIKDVRTKSRKIDIPPPCPQNVLNPPCMCGHPKNFEKSEVFCSKKFGRSHLKKPIPLVRKKTAMDKLLPLTADVFYGRPLVQNTWRTEEVQMRAVQKEVSLDPADDDRKRCKKNSPSFLSDIQ